MEAPSWLLERISEGLMPHKALNVVLLVFMVVVDGAILYTVPEPMLRLGLGLLLLVPLILVAAHLQIAEAFSKVADTQHRARRFPALRANVNHFLTEVKRLNWLVVDLDRGFGRPETTAAEIDACQRRMEEILLEIRASAGKASEEDGFDRSAGDELSAPAAQAAPGGSEPGD